MPWRSMSVVEQRLEFCRLGESGELSHTELCRRYGISRQTGYKWLARFEAEGPAGLVDRSRAPRTSPTRTSPEMEELVLGVRDDHEPWGGRKIRGVLLRRGEVGVPQPSTITEILRRNGRLREPSRGAGYGSFEYPAPNQLWQMDFKGWFRLVTREPVHPFGMLDDHSRYNLRLRACKNQQTLTVQGHLRGAFERYGLPDAILADNGSPWGNTPEQTWNPLTTWLTDLDIRVLHSRPRHPQTVGKEERFHRTLNLEVIARRPQWRSFTEVQAAFDEWRTIYNHHRPHQALGETVVPADRYQPSPRSYPTRINPPQYPDGTDIRKVSTNARFSWRNRSWRAGKAFIGRPIGIRPTPIDGTYAVYYRHHKIRTITIP